eukprot:Hpha_TRINITY_DN16583_c5_g1::TRINITY_DN16583_c5_g1_i3::g.134819::m.134819
MKEKPAEWGVEDCDSSDLQLKEGVWYKALRTEHYAHAVDLLANGLVGNVETSMCGLGEKEVRAFWELVVPWACHNGPSVIAFDNASNEPIGVLLAKDSKEPPPHGLDRFILKYPQADAIQAAGAALRLRKQSSEDRVYAVIAVGVAHHRRSDDEPHDVHFELSRSAHTRFGQEAVVLDARRRAESGHEKQSPSCVPLVAPPPPSPASPPTKGHLKGKARLRRLTRPGGSAGEAPPGGAHTWLTPLTPLSSHTTGV